jgi:hypothetical protein
MVPGKDNKFRQKTAQFIIRLIKISSKINQLKVTH